MPSPYLKIFNFPGLATECCYYLIMVCGHYIAFEISIFYFDFVLIIHIQEIIYENVVNKNAKNVDKMWLYNEPSDKDNL